MIVGVQVLMAIILFTLGIAACLGEASAPRPVELPVAPAAAD